jgi:NitT/TauT family transport system substrate-binding protein
METFRSVFYTPIYVTVAGGYLEAEGLDVTFRTCPPDFTHPISALNEGAADIVQSGIMRGIIASDWGAETVPKHIAKINARDGFFVLGRDRGEEFSWDDFRGATVIPVGFSPMPWASFQYALRKNGVDPGELNLVPGLPLLEAVEMFRQRSADFIHLPEPAAEQLLEDEVGHLVVSLGVVNGHLAYSSFAATNEFIRSNSETAHRFLAGYGRALTWLADNDATEVGSAVSDFFPGVSKELVIRSVDRYKAQDTWPLEPSLNQPEFEALQDILIAAGLTRQRQPYAKVVHAQFATA